MMEFKNNISDYTESEFIELLNTIFKENASESDVYLDKLLKHFERITEHPEGTDIIYYAPSDTDCTPENILEKVKKWRAENGKPGFKE